MLRGVHQRERHDQRIRHQHRPPPSPHPPPQEDRDRRAQTGVQGRDRRDQIDAGLPLVDQPAGRVEVEPGPAARRDSLDPFVGARLRGAHLAEDAAVGHLARGTEHAARRGRPGDDVGGGTPGGRPWRGGRQHHVDRQRTERQHHEQLREFLPLRSVAQPQHGGDHVRQDEERHVGGADDHLPPGRVGLLEMLLQPDGGHHPEEHPAVGIGLPMPQRGSPDQVRGPTAEVVDHQHQGERQPVSQHVQHPPATDAGDRQAGADVEQQQFAVERDSGGGDPVGDDDGPHTDGDAPYHGEAPIPGGGRIVRTRCRDWPLVDRGHMGLSAAGDDSSGQPSLPLRYPGFEQCFPVSPPGGGQTRPDPPAGAMREILPSRVS